MEIQKQRQFLVCWEALNAISAYLDRHIGMGFINMKAKEHSGLAEGACLSPSLFSSLIPQVIPQQRLASYN